MEKGLKSKWLNLKSKVISKEANPNENSLNQSSSKLAVTGNGKKSQSAAKNNTSNEESEIVSAMAKNISDAFQMPIKEPFKTTNAQSNANTSNLFSNFANKNEESRMNLDDDLQRSKMPVKFKPVNGDTTVKEFVKLEYFKKKYKSCDFVENIATNAFGARKNKNEFDPKPYLKCFEAVIDELLKIKKKVKSKIEDNEDSINASEVSRRKKMVEIKSQFENLKSTFISIESNLAQVGKTAIRIGGQLELIDKQRNRALDAKDLIQYFSDFKSNDTSRLDLLQSTGKEGEAKCAMIAKRLMALSRDMDISGTETAKFNIERYVEKIEMNYLERFDAAYKEKNYDIMNAIALILYEFNGGISCNQIYINQNDFFIKRVMESGRPFLSEDNLYVDYTKVPDEIEKLYISIITTCHEEWNVISIVFPNPAEVMQQFIQRIIAQTVQFQIERILQDAEIRSQHAFLETLKVLHEVTAKLIKELHNFDEKVMINITKKPTLQYVLNRCYEDLFVPYIDSEKYVKIEYKWLSDACTKILEPFTAFAVSHGKIYKRNKNGKVSLLTSTKEAMATLNVTQLLNFEDSAKTSILVNGEPSRILNIKTTMFILKAHFESLERCKELSYPINLPRNAGSLLILLMNIIGKQYAFVNLDMVLDELETTDQKSEPTFGHLPIVKVAHEVIQLVQLHFQQSMVPIINQAPTVHRDMIFFKNEFISNIETKLNTILQKSMENLVNWFEYTLSKQKKTDFKPKEDDSNIDAVSCTPTCLMITNVIKSLGSRLESVFDGRNRELFLTETCYELHSMLLEHFRKFPINPTGALLISKDIQKYHESVLNFGIDSVIERFDLLREIGSLFISKIESLKTIIKEGYLSRLEITYLKPYIMMRSDWATILKMERELNLGLG